MNKLCWSFLVLFIWGALGAQIQDLPDLQVSGEADVRSFLNKRALLFAPLSSEPESLAAYLPQSLWQDVPTPKVKAAFPRSYLQLEANTGLGVVSYFNHHSASSSLQSLSHQLDLWNPNDSLLAFQTRFRAGVDIADRFPITLDAVWHNNTAPDYRVSSLSFLAAHFRPELQLARVKLQNYNLQISGEYLRQRELPFHYHAQSVNIQAAGIASSGVMDLKHLLLLSGGKVGGMALPGINWHPWGIISLRPGFVADQYAIAPTLDFLYRTTLSEGLSLKVENKPTINANKPNDILVDTPWVDLSGKYRLSPVPLNLSCIAEMVHFPGYRLPLGRIVLENNLAYTINALRLDTGIKEGIPLLVYNDLIQNSTTASAMLRIGDLTVHQELAVNLAYLPEKHYQRAAYQPLLKVTTQADYSLGHYLLHANLLQSYFSKDHKGADLPEAVICDLAAEYLLGDKSLYVNLSNLFDLPVITYTQYPTRGRALFLGLKYRF